jgi:hypothetical protein
MATLDRWRPFLTTPHTLVFPRLELIGHDSEPPLVKGSGEVRMPSLREFEFTLEGLPDDVGYVQALIMGQLADPYDRLARFRLRGVDRHGLEWSLGWTVPHIDPGDGTWRFEGRIDALQPHDVSDTVATESSTELLFLIPTQHAIAFFLQRFLLTKHLKGESRYERVLQVLGSDIRFRYEPLSGVLSVTATHSPGMPPTYTENWLGEPLRILFGQLDISKNLALLAGS